MDFPVPPGSSIDIQLQLIGRDKHVLDVGCATGYTGYHLQQQGCTVYGIEYDPERAEIAAERLEKVLVCDLDHATSEDLVAQFGAESFDVMNFGDVLEHLRDPVTTLRNMKPLLRPGGYVVISVPNIAHGDVRLMLLTGRFQYNSVGILDNTHLRHFTNASLTAFLDEAGFVQAELERVCIPMFHTEFGVREGDYPPVVVDSLRNDPEAVTYQFVTAGIPVEWAALAAVDGDADAVRTERDELREKLDRVVEIAQRTQQINEQLVADLAAAREELAALQGVPVGG